MGAVTTIMRQIAIDGGSGGADRDVLGRRGRTSADTARGAHAGVRAARRRPHAGSITVAFAGTDAFTNPFGEVLGGFLAAMLYDTVGPALLATLPPGRFIETLELHTKFVRPAGTGRLIGRGRVVGVDGELAELDGALHDAAGRVVATATATARIVSVDPAAAMK